MTTAEEAALRVREAETRQREKLEENLHKVEALTQRLTKALTQKRPANPALEGPGQELFMKAGAAYMAEVMEHPERILEHQVSYWGKALKHYVDAQATLAKGKLAAPADPGPKDRRFANPLWDTHPWFNFLKQQYLISAEAVQTAVAGLDHLDERDRRRIEYFTKQIVDMMAPTNFLATNPDALERAVATDGQSLVDGMENLVRDIEASHGDLLITLADPKAFRVGENIGTSPGSVVWRNELFELIQYAPSTEKVHKIPLIIFPPWINKFYILDMKPSNSMVKWIVDQGFTLFVVSWKNPDASYADKGMDDYVQDGYLAAIEQVKAITGQKKVNAVGYCIAGTTLTLTLGLMDKRGDKSVNAATFFTTLTDFSDQGEFIPFLDDDFLDGIEAQVAHDGVLSKYFMNRTFSFLRSNDLIYQPAIRSYMMGEAPPAFDLLFWNGDGTNLPAKMAVQYLRLLCQQDRLATEGFPVLGEVVRLSDMKVPLCAIACETDHIAAWQASFAGIRQMASKDKTFILSESGHIAGIINPPGRDKYGHYTSSAPVDGVPTDWKAAAEFTRGSWWPHWGEWLAGKSGTMVAARQPGSPDHPVLAPAPGTYVSEVVDA
ncbi:class I poly(R)-hydroxyalkanoic acid synthase [Frigidibacter albus]|uniref:Class I poly(R)-hydroxyalkanoic acid synthase n=1 Tax=Frigidibacter albus TaxID=1465486 RepID=A0A6L8VJZ1_9RHOB|nr:class I poly(R)-hydroxyalkanoic acid synthase [Frigidibacter albus]MZQ89932.1 class I poly(R)-hydroxyalkanoic acid synthase [Frigidibacter albus]NBE31693.1 class I poly(R)-hydroxyalkanoic acid synthase [Frigidibacter albus]GGH55922.1 class I poly(R)-hydroxyalkanoic acid synthase [Frigidibacter albus]